MPAIHAAMEPARLSLFAALGLLACGPVAGMSTGDSSSTGAGFQPTGTSSISTGPQPTGTGTASSGVSGTASTSPDPTSGGVTASSTGGTSPESSTGTTGTPGATTMAGTTGGSTGDSGIEPGCEALMQGFTDPPVPSGWQKCGDLLPHRVSAEVCGVPATPSDCIDGGACDTNDDCQELLFGSCRQRVADPGCFCAYGCESDADCEAGTVCRCAGDVLGPYTRCVASECTIDGDCGDELCQFSQYYGLGCGLEDVENGACTTPDDLCVTDTPCEGGPCGFTGEKWVCTGVQCGRPFVVDGEAVTGPAVAREDWSAVLEIADAPAALREPLARYWTQIARCEHASIASFARFSLQLLAVGAPPYLLLAAQRALADEVEHARVSFALASHHAGRAIGPGPLGQADSPGAHTLVEIVEAVIREACIGETLSALEVREACEQAADPGLCRLLRAIADDEQRHAELGWCFVRWALRGAGPAVHARVQVAFAAAIAGATTQAERMSRGPGARELRVHGVVDEPLRAAVWREGLRSLVVPAAAALLAADHGDDTSMPCSVRGVLLA